MTASIVPTNNSFKKNECNGQSVTYGWSNSDGTHAAQLIMSKRFVVTSNETHQ